MTNQSQSDTPVAQSAQGKTRGRPVRIYVTEAEAAAIVDRAIEMLADDPVARPSTLILAAWKQVAAPGRQPPEYVKQFKCVPPRLIARYGTTLRRYLMLGIAAGRGDVTPAVAPKAGLVSKYVVVVSSAPDISLPAVDGVKLTVATKPPAVKGYDAAVVLVQGISPELLRAAFMSYRPSRIKLYEEAYDQAKVAEVIRAAASVVVAGGC